MPHRIQEDHGMFRDAVAGKIRGELKKWQSSGRIFRHRPGRKGTISIPIPRIDVPRFRHGGGDTGVGSGPGGEGDIISTEPGKGPDGRGASNDDGDAILVDIDMKTIIAEMGEDLNLPNMLPKENDTFEETKIRYVSLSKIGSESLLHKRKTLLHTLKRMSASGLLGDEHKKVVPGFADPIIPLTPIQDDKRYRQWKEEKIPSSNAVIFFARDISGSMNPFKCDIVSDVAWWIDCWIQQFYEKVERCYVVHDTKAREVDSDRFYKMRLGGGTLCSTAMEYIGRQLKHRYPPARWNVYVFYFSDGDNWMGDNEKFVRVIKRSLTPTKVNLLGITQILPWRYQDTVKEAVDKAIISGELDNKFVRTSGVARPTSDNSNQMYGYWGWGEEMDEESRDLAVRNVIKDLLGTHKQNLEATTSAA